MEVYIRYSGKRIKQCGGDPEYDKAGCGGEIMGQEPIVRGFWWYDKKRYYKSWHFDCWVRGAREWFEANPFVPKVRGVTGRQSLMLSPEGYKKRRSLLGYASQIRRQKAEQLQFLYSRGQMAEFQSQAFQYNERLRKIWDRLLEIGGPPKSSFRLWSEYTSRSA